MRNVAIVSQRGYQFESSKCYKYTITVGSALHVVSTWSILFIENILSAETRCIESRKRIGDALQKSAKLITVDPRGLYFLIIYTLAECRNLQTGPALNHA